MSERAVDKMIERLRQFDGALESVPTDELQQIICAGCDFYSPEKEKLQCGAFRIIAALIKKGRITRNDLIELGE